MFQCKNKTNRVYNDCSWSHGLSEYRILKFPENWVNLQSAKEELLYWWSLMTSFQSKYGYFLSTSLVSRSLTLLIHDKCGWDGDVMVTKIMVNNSTRKQLNQNNPVFVHLFDGNTFLCLVKCFSFLIGILSLLFSNATTITFTTLHIV